MRMEYIAGLSAQISFYEIGAVDEKNVVTTTLPEAIKFVIDLEKRESGRLSLRGRYACIG